MKTSKRNVLPVVLAAFGALAVASTSTQAIIWDPLVMDPIIDDVLATVAIAGAFILTVAITIKGYKWVRSAL